MRYLEAAGLENVNFSGQPRARQSRQNGICVQIHGICLPGKAVAVERRLQNCQRPSGLSILTLRCASQNQAYNLKAQADLSKASVDTHRWVIKLQGVVRKLEPLRQLRTTDIVGITACATQSNDGKGKGKHFEGHDGFNAQKTKVAVLVCYFCGRRDSAEGCIRAGSPRNRQRPLVSGYLLASLRGLRAYSGKKWACRAPKTSDRTRLDRFEGVFSNLQPRAPSKQSQDLSNCLFENVTHSNYRRDP